MREGTRGGMRGCLRESVRRDVLRGVYEHVRKGVRGIVLGGMREGALGRVEKCIFQFSLKFIDEFIQLFEQRSEHVS